LVATLYKANAIAMPTELAMHIWMAFAMINKAFMIVCFNWLFRLLKCSSVNLLWVQSPIVIGMQRCLRENNHPTIVGVLCAMQFVADVLTSVVAFDLVNYHQRPVDDSFECL
jgi:hypothetical protein